MSRPVFTFPVANQMTWPQNVSGQQFACLPTPSPPEGRATVLAPRFHASQKPGPNTALIYRIMPNFRAQLSCSPGTLPALQIVIRRVLLTGFVLSLPAEPSPFSIPPMEIIEKFVCPDLFPAVHYLKIACKHRQRRSWTQKTQVARLPGCYSALREMYIH